MPSDKNIICIQNALPASLLCAYEIKIVKVLPEGLFLYFDAGMTEEYACAILNKKSTSEVKCFKNMLIKKLFRLGHHFFHFRYHTFHHAFNTGFQSYHAAWATAATSLHH